MTDNPTIDALAYQIDLLKARIVELERKNKKLVADNKALTEQIENIFKLPIPDVIVPEAIQPEVKEPKRKSKK